MQIEEKIRDLLSDDDNVRFAYLFGSYANKTTTEKSDIDLAVFLDTPTADAILSLHHRLQKTLHKELDLVILNNIKNLYLLEAIINDGIVVKDATMRPEYEVEMQHRIIDFKAFKRMINAA